MLGRGRHVLCPGGAGRGGRPVGFPADRTPQPVKKTNRDLEKITMNGSWKLGQLAGVQVQIHWTFLLLPLVIAGSTWTSAGAAAAVAAVVFVLAIFGCVILHELGHALAARRFGIQTRDITLLPIGGVARLQRMPRQPLQELVIALAGPAVNVLIAALLLGTLRMQGYTLAQTLSLELLQTSFLTRLMWANVILVLFNLLPAFPMDGGRVVRSILALAVSYLRATQIAVVIGRIMAVAFAAWAFYSGSWMLLFIAAFVYLAGSSELAMARLQASTDGLSVDDLMQRQFHTVSADSPLNDLVLHLPLGTQRDYPVVRNQQLVGMLNAGTILREIAEGGGDRLASEVMRREVPWVDRRDMLSDTLTKLSPVRMGGLPVCDQGVVVGVLPVEHIRNCLHSLASKSPPWVVRGLREEGG